MIDFFEQFIAAIWNRLRGRGRGARQRRRGLTLVLEWSTARTHADARDAQQRATRDAHGGTRENRERQEFFPGISPRTSKQIADSCISISTAIHAVSSSAPSMPERRLRRHLSDKLILVEPADPIVSVGLNPWNRNRRTLSASRSFRGAPQALGTRSLRSAHGRTPAEFALRARGERAHARRTRAVPRAPRIPCSLPEARPERRGPAVLRTALRPVERSHAGRDAGADSQQDVGLHGVDRTSATSWAKRIRRSRSAKRWTRATGSSSISTKGGWASRRSPWAVCSSPCSRTRSSPGRSDRSSPCTATRSRTFCAVESGIETMLSEAASSAWVWCSANSSLRNNPRRCARPSSRVGTHIFFQLSSADAQQVSKALDGGKPLAERLKNLPQRHCVVKSGSDRWMEVCVPTVREPKVDYTDLLNRSRYARGRRARPHRTRHRKTAGSSAAQTDEVLHDWE